MMIGPRLASSTTPSQTMAIGSTISDSARSANAVQSFFWAWSSRHHMGVPRRLVAAELPSGCKAFQPVDDPHRVRQQQIDNRQRGHENQPKLTVMHSADRSEEYDQNHPRQR